MTTSFERQFHHIGLPAPDQATPIPGESWVAGSRCWVSNPSHHPKAVEWIRFAPDSPVDPGFQVSPHLCYTIDDLDAALAGKDVTIPPVEVGEPPFGRAAFVEEDGISVEYLQIYPGRAWFDDASESDTEAG